MIHLLLAALLFFQGPMFPGPGGKASGSSPTTVTLNLTSGGTDFGGGSTLITSGPFRPSTGNAVVVFAFVFTSADIISVCDGTGTDQCTGGSTYTSTTAYANTGWFTQIWYTCNYQSIIGSDNTVTVHHSSTNGLYGIAVVATGNTTAGTSCIDGYNKNQDTGSSTAITSGSVTTTNSADLLLGFVGAGGTVSAGNDGQGGSMAGCGSRAAIVACFYRNESATATYAPTSTLSSAGGWNAETVAIK